MNDLKSIIAKILKSSPSFEEHRDKVEIFDAWPRVVGERAAKHSWPVRLLEDGALLVAAESNAWLQSLRYLEPQIIEKFEKELGPKRVRALKFKLETRRGP